MTYQNSFLIFLLIVTTVFVYQIQLIEKYIHLRSEKQEISVGQDISGIVVAGKKFKHNCTIFY